MAETIQLGVQLFDKPKRAAVAAALLELMRVPTATSKSTSSAVVLQELEKGEVFKRAIDNVIAAIDGEGK